MKPDLLVIGSFYDWDIAAMAETFELHHVSPHVDPATLDETVRTSLRFATLKGHAPLDGTFMDAFPSLEIIANYGVGFDAIDVEAAKARNIRVTNTPDVLNDDVADLAVLLLLSRLRDSFGSERWVRDGNWPSGDYPLQTKLSGAHIGILGLGRIGRSIADRLVAFGCRISYFARSEKETPGWTYHATPVALAGAVDHMVVVVVGGPDTEGLVNRDVLSALGPTGVLVNVSRGSVIDERALLDLLESGALGGAALDVFWDEPNIDARFHTLQNVTLLPHVGSATEETRRAMGRLVYDNLEAHRTGAPLPSAVC